MSAPTLDRPVAASPAPQASPTGGRRDVGPGLGWSAFGARSTAGRTARTALGLALGLTPLFVLVGDVRWYVVGVGAMAVTVGPAWALRLWQRADVARVWQLLPGVILLPFYLTAVCVPTGSWAGLVPTHVTWTQLSLLHDELVSTIARSTAPIESTPGIRLALAVLLGLGAIMVDILCTVLEAPAMVGLVLLPVYVLSGSTVREPVSWWLFALAALGYLLMLSTSGPAARAWGREIGRRPEGAAPSLVSSRRIAAIAVVAGMVVPLFAFGNAYNPLSDALHRSSNGGGQGGGNGTGGVTQLASLKGTLTLSTPVDLMTVTVPAGAPVEPYYLRQAVLDLFTGGGWIPAGISGSTGLARSGLPQDPARPSGPTYAFRADVNVSGLNGRPVTFADTVGAEGLPRGTDWDPSHGTFVGGTVRNGTRYSVGIEQPTATAAVLGASTSALPPDFPQQWTRTPDISPTVRALTQQVVGAAATRYAKARALVDYFTDGTHGFRYDLQVPAGDSGDDLTDFLTDKQGFCQQYAAAMAVMLRLADVPSRVVVGYTHVAPDRAGQFTVTTRDAHAWVEAYLGGIGWTSFDPTPLTGSDAARRVAPSYLGPTAGATTTAPGGVVPSASSSSGVGDRRDQDLAGDTTLLGPAPTVAGPDHTGAWVALWVLVGVAVVVLLVPAVRRRVLRRRRHRLRGPGAVEARFEELRDVCLDLGLDWTSSRSPRQTSAWLRGLGLAPGLLAPLVAAVEQVRYGRHPDLAPDVRAVDPSLSRTVAALRGRATTWQRLRAAWWPRSVTDAIRAGTRVRVARLREAFAGWSARPTPSLRAITLSRKARGGTR